LSPHPGPRTISPHPFPGSPPPPPPPPGGGRGRRPPPPPPRPPGARAARGPRPATPTRAGHVPGARRVGPVRDQGLERRRAHDAPRQVVVGQADRGDAGRVLGLVVGQPAQLRHGQGGDGHGAGGLGPPRGPFGPRVVAGVGAAFADEVAGGARRTGVVPQQCGPDDIPVRVEADHAVLLAPHGERGDVVEASGEFDGLQESGPPRLGVDLGPLRMRGSALAHDAFPGRVVDDYLARLCRRVDAGDVWTAVAHGASLGSDSGRGRLGADRGRDPGRCAGPVTWRTCRRRRPRANRRGCPRRSADPPTVRGARRPGGRGRRPPSPRRSRGRTRGRAGRSTSRG